MMMIIDRFEGEYAVCEKSGDGVEESFVNIPKVLLPKGAREGDCLTRDENGSWAIDADMTARRRSAIRERLANLYHSED